MSATLTPSPVACTQPALDLVVAQVLEQAERAIGRRAMHGLYVSRAEAVTIVRGAVWTTVLELCREMEQVAEARVSRLPAAAGPTAREALQAFAAALRHRRRELVEVIGAALQAARELAE